MDNKELKERLAFSSVNNINNNASFKDTDPKNLINDAFNTREQSIKEKQQVNRIKEKYLSDDTKEVIEKQTTDNIKIKKKFKMKKNFKKVIILILISTLLIISYFFYKNYINNPKVIQTKALYKLNNELLDIIPIKNQATLIGDNYSIETNLSTSLESEKVQNSYQTNSKMLEYYYLINNLNNTNTTFTIKKDLKNKKFFYNRLTKLNDQIVINDKYLIENSTEYYYIKDFFDTYINDGNNNYFETINKEKNTINNISYLYNFILSSISNNIEIDDFNVTNTTTYLDENMEKVKKVSIKLTNSKIRKIVNGVINDLKKDERSFNILNAIYDDFINYKISSKTKFLQDNEVLTINFYTKGLLCTTKKYEIALDGNNKSIAFTYEIDNKKITILANNNVKYYVTYTNDNNKINGIIYDVNNKEVGKIGFERDTLKSSFSISLDDDVNNIAIDINSKVTNKTKSSYKNTITSNLSIKKNKENILSGVIKLDSIITNKVEITEQVKEVIFSSRITEENKEELEQLLKMRLKKEIVS